MQRKMVQAVIFDMDGVLVDSQPLHFDADILTLEKCGIKAGLSDVQKYAGMSNADRWAKYKKDYNIEKPTGDIIKLHAGLISELLETREIHAVNYAGDVLEMLKNKGISLSVASSSSYAFVFNMLKKIGLSHFFDIVISGEDFQNSKPSPDIFIYAAEKHNANAGDCIIIEDSSNGVKAAQAAGITCIGYKNPSSGVQDLSQASFITDSFEQLLNNTDWLYN